MTALVLQVNNGEKSGECTEGMAVRPDEDGTKLRRRGFPRIIKAGHGIKQGAVVHHRGLSTQGGLNTQGASTHRGSKHTESLSTQRVSTHTEGSQHIGVSTHRGVSMHRGVSTHRGS